ncbi:recombinase family protein [Sphingobium yanoikuyae]|uniref:Recombinase family protein n=1 Tax=Sphingobium yanoikuyae TaxID=13690 RepID=A0A3G2URG8_SPHYA|nr:recombinase family protein [Sphingobium yanoikuyae]AYO75451.1 recombinase family protein [Sphingobium yanoikuyae]
MAIVGYARVSTDEQDTAAQVMALKAAGATLIFEDKASGASQTRAELTRALNRVGQGDTLLVVRIDRLARSLNHLLQIVEDLSQKGAYFRSLSDQFDTSSAQGLLMMQMLGAFAEFERRLIKERTLAGVAAAKARGAKPGNPKMIAHDPTAILELKISHKDRHLAQLIDGRMAWLPIVERLRPHQTWRYTLLEVQRLKNLNRTFSYRTLIKSCQLLVNSGHAKPEILLAAPRNSARSSVVHKVGYYLKTNPQASLRSIAQWLDEIREPTPRGMGGWTPEAVRRIKSQGIEIGIIPRTGSVANMGHGRAASPSWGIRQHWRNAY